MEKVIQTVNAFGKLNKRDALCVSLSGGVDSMVLLRALREYQLKTKFYKTIKQFHLKAVHVNYNNRSDCDKEVDFVVNYCDSIGVPIEVRHITEMKRVRDRSRHEYEEFTRKARFEMYRKQECAILIGHNFDDTVENIISNVASKKKYDNLFGMSKQHEEDGVTVLRPLLDVPKKDIYEYATAMNVPHLPDSTPEWSRRGKLRDHVIPALERCEPQFIRGLVHLAEHLRKENERMLLYGPRSERSAVSDMHGSGHHPRSEDVLRRENEAGMSALREKVLLE
jgi:tRNA(Ile)-lysidine synthetase-like protein